MEHSIELANANCIISSSFNCKHQTLAISSPFDKLSQKGHKNK